MSFITFKINKQKTKEPRERQDILRCQAKEALAEAVALAVAAF